MKKFLLSISLSAITLLGCENTAGPVVGKAEVIDFGIYELMTRDKVAQQGSVTGYSRAVVDKTLKETTTEIPLIQGTSFGFRYKLHGSPDGEAVPIILKVTHPPVTPPGKSTPQTISKGTDVATIGQININAGWVFEEEWALVPGKWTIEVLHKGKKLAGKEFTITEQKEDPILEEPVRVENSSSNNNTSVEVSEK